ncbi:MAG: ferritin-like protein [Alphaproteobacteria bacterium]
MSLYKIKDVAELNRHLYAAMQLEHATIPVYLTALYSIVPGTNSEGYHILRAVAVEEMLHLTLVCNLVNAVGGRPNLSQPGFTPNYPCYLPDGEEDFSVSLQRFSPDAIETFLKIERPATLGPHESSKRHRKRKKGLLAAGHTGEEEHFFSIGEFYKAIETGLDDLYAEMGEALFCGDPALQVGPEYYYSGGGGLIKVHDMASAKQALDLIAEQGEGITENIFDSDGEIAHYYRFQQLILGRYYVEGDRHDHPTGNKVPVDWNAVYPIKTNAKVADMPEGSGVRAAVEAFNLGYSQYLALLTRAFNGEPALLVDAVGVMFNLKELTYQMMRQTIGDGSGTHAAPTFEINLP